MFAKIIGELCIGFLTTLEIFALTLVFALPLGLVVCFAATRKFAPVRYLTRGVIWIVRGTPLMLQLLIVCYGPGLMGLPPVREPMIAVIVAFSLNYACYFAEIYRGGIAAVSAGQWEAGKALGLSRGRIFMRIVFPQVIKRILPPMSNEVITIVKDTSLANTIAVAEIIRCARNLTGTYAVDIMIPLLYAGAFYLVFVGLLTVVFNRLEKKLRG